MTQTMSADCIPTVHVETTRFGALDVSVDLILEFADGMIGFEDCKRFVVLHHDENSPFKWLQSLDDGAVAFPVIDPWLFWPNYAPTVSDADAESIQLAADTPKLVFAVVTVPRNDPARITANLLGPVVINAITRRGKQVVVMDDCYTTKHLITEELARNARK